MAVVLMLTACNKRYLERTPSTALPVDIALQTEADLQVAIRAAYAAMRAVDLYGRSAPLFGDLLADNVYVSSSNSGRYIPQNNYAVSVADGTVAGLWSNSYTVILRCNNIINSKVPTNANVSHYKGEALAIRALMYFDLVRFFSKPYSEDPNTLGVPIILDYDPERKPARNRINEVYDQIIKDLNEAYGMMTLIGNSAQFNKHVAKALLAKVYLNKGDNANANAAALELINNSGYTVVSATGHNGFWINGAARTDKVETLLEISSDAVNNNGVNSLTFIYHQSGYGDMLCSDDLYALYTATDVRRAYLVRGTRGGIPSVFVNKYPNNSGDRDNTKILRMSEVYLIAAESSLPANETDARTYLNYVATRRDASFLGYTSSGAQLFEDIIRERRKELAFEGDRFHDLNRLKRPIARSNNYPAAARNIPYPDNRRVAPIPRVERDANPTIEQNDGYN